MLADQTMGDLPRGPVQHRHGRDDNLQLLGDNHAARALTAEATPSRATATSGTATNTGGSTARAQKVHAPVTVTETSTSPNARHRDLNVRPALGYLGLSLAPDAATPIYVEDNLDTDHTTGSLAESRNNSRPS